METKTGLDTDYQVVTACFRVKKSSLLVGLFASQKDQFLLSKFESPQEGLIQANPAPKWSYKLPMDDLRGICKVLDANDVKLVKRYYGGQADTQKRLKLFELIRKGNSAEDITASLDISAEALRKLQTRLQQDLLNLILFRGGSGRTDAPYRQAEIDCRKLLLQGDILLKKGATATGIKLLQKATRIAEKHELPTEGVLIDDILRTHFGFRKGLKAYEKYSGQLSRKMELMRQVLRAKEMNQRILLPRMFSRKENVEDIELAAATYKELGKAFKETGSPNIGYFYFLTSLFYHDFQQNWEDAHKVALGFRTLIKNEAAIYSRNRMANANLQLANIQMQRYEFEEAAFYASEATELSKTGLNNELTSMEFWFMGLFMDQQFEEAKQLMSRAFLHPKIKATAFTESKWVFLRAALSFKLKKFETAQQDLLLDSALMKDKSGWLFGHKLLEILCLAEAEDFAFIEFRLEAMRKLHQQRKGTHSERLSLIIRILSELVKNDFNYRAVRDKRAGELASLAKDREQYFWNPLGFEIIRFDEWFQTKVEVAV